MDPPEFFFFDEVLEQLKLIFRKIFTLIVQYTWIFKLLRDRLGIYLAAIESCHVPKRKK